MFRRLRKSALNYIESQSKVSFWLGAGLILPLVLYVFYGVIARYILRHALRGTIEIPSFMMLVIICASLSYVQMSGTNIRIDALFNRLPSRAQKVLNIIINILILIFTSFALWGCWNTTMSSLEDGLRSSTMEAPIFPFQLFMSLTFFFLFLQVIVQIAKAIVKPDGNKEQ